MRTAIYHLTTEGETYGVCACTVGEARSLLRWRLQEDGHARSVAQWKADSAKATIARGSALNKWDRGTVLHY